jgi:hypothetical protein
VAYRKLVSPSPSALLPEEQFRLYAICARSPQKLPQQVPWRVRQPGVYDCTWGTDTIRVVVAGELPREAHNALLHVISASVELVNFGGKVYEPQSEYMSALLAEMFERYREEGLAVLDRLKDFSREYMKEHLPELTPQERAEILQALPPEERLAGLPPEERLAGLSVEQIRQYLDQVTTGRRAPSRRPRRKK